jgi:hypothetical protein
VRAQPTAGGSTTPTTAPECDVRWLANLDSGSRPAVFEQIGHQVDAKALARIKELVGNEIVRQKLLREAVK